MTRKSLRFALGLLLTLLFLWLILRHIRLEELQRAFTGTHLTWIGAALAAFVVGYACRIERWRLMLERDSPRLKWTDCAGPLLTSFAANNVLPFRAGDVMRAFAFNRQLGTSSGVVIATLFVERLLDFLMVLALLGAALAIFDLDAERIAGVGSTVLIGAAAAILAMLLFPHFFAPLAHTLGRVIARRAPAVGQKLLDEVDRSFATLRHLAQGRTMFKLVGWSLTAWLAEGCVFWFAALALPSITVPLAGWLALPIGTLATLIPSTPGYVGTFDYFTSRAMAEPGNAAAATTAYAFLVHALLWIPPTVIGGIYLLLHSLRQHGGLRLMRTP